MNKRTLIEDEKTDSITGGNYLWKNYPGCHQVWSDADSTGAVYDFSGYTMAEIQTMLDELKEDYSEKAALKELMMRGVIRQIQ